MTIMTKIAIAVFFIVLIWLAFAIATPSAEDSKIAKCLSINSVKVIGELLPVQDINTFSKENYKALMVAYKSPALKSDRQRMFTLKSKLGDIGKDISRSIYFACMQNTEPN